MTHTIHAEPLTKLCRDIFAAAGAPADIAALVAESLVNTNLFGHDSHGALRVMQYITMIRAGMIQPEQRPQIRKRFGATAMVRGGNGFGQVGARFAAGLVRRLGADYGIAAVSLGQTTHIGRLGEYTAHIAAAGLVGIGFTSGSMYSGWVTPYGGRERLFGTNPMSFAVPCPGDETLLLDFATAGVAHGKIVLARAKGIPAPSGMMLDKHGKPTTDAQLLDEGAVLLPMGLHKGSGLAMMMELIPTLLAGHRPISAPDFSFGNPTLLLAISPAAFDNDRDFAEQVAALKARVKAAQPAAGFDEVLLPGEPEARAYAKRSQTGIPLPDAVWADLRELAAELGVAIPGL
ncbi:MAG: Ldh family oxidoreductase [Chloroflexi bacterium]|nr:Ldh family oxidoreductase [Chloroflexota bacterium]MCY3583743.1 Ldh family oxidoreductase [Chloroflexota bacterium]MCY3717811.1 Ldh family oxidoreductase [Chloroflexota bacterium]MXV91921.1 Ldh family oxidoreductase [Chloroflexota bacterium]MXX51344.1 Ldh family oxidoreductase [Chloroflexota bacterium]